MPASVNLVILIGHIGGEPELRHAGDTPLCSFNLATSERWTGPDGASQEKTTWHRVVAWSRLGETCHRHLRKGSRVYVEGRIQTRSYEKDGQTRSVTEIKATSVQFLDTKEAR